jgi:hypothetical protein
MAGAVVQPLQDLPILPSFTPLLAIISHRHEEAMVRLRSLSDRRAQPSRWRHSRCRQRRAFSDRAKADRREAVARALSSNAATTQKWNAGERVCSGSP